MDRKSVVILGVIFGGLFLALFGFLFLAFVAVHAGGEGGSLSGGPAIGVLEVKGVIGESDKALKDLRRFERDDHIKAVLVRIDSPGGAVAPSQEINAALRKMAETKPVVCSLGDLAASGGYYIAVGCQKILASPGTLTGSIGVITQLPYLGGVADALKFQVVTIKSGALKDAGNPFRQMTDQDRKYFQDIINVVYEQFVAAVAEGRGLTVDEVRPWADGRVITGEKAKELKFIDDLGNFNEAIKLAAALGGISGEPRLQYPPEHRPFPFDAFLEDGGRALARGVRQELMGSVGHLPSIQGPAYLAPLPGLSATSEGR